MELETDADGRSPITDVNELKSRLARLDAAENSFAILFRDEETYLQTAANADGFIVERRDGDFARHYYATRPDSHQTLRSQAWIVPKADRGQDRFSQDEMISMFCAYFSGSMFHNVAWARMDMADPNALGTKVLQGLRVTFWVVVALMFVGLWVWLKWQ